MSNEAQWEATLPPNLRNTDSIRSCPNCELYKIGSSVCRKHGMKVGENLVCDNFKPEWWEPSFPPNFKVVSVDICVNCENWRSAACQQHFNNNPVGVCNDFTSSV